jgi:hypothetical protein
MGIKPLILLCTHTHTYNILKQECTNPGGQLALVTEFCTVAPNIYASSVRAYIYVTLLGPTTSRRLLEIFKICVPL